MSAADPEGVSMFGSSFDPVPDGWEPPVGGAIAEPTVPRLIAMLDLRACVFESFPFDAQLPRIEPGRIVLPPEEPGIRSWAGQACVELPVRHDGLTLGRFVLVPASPTTGVAFSPESRAAAISIASSVGARIAASLVNDLDDDSRRERADGVVASDATDPIAPRAIACDDRTEPRSSGPGAHAGRGGAGNARSHAPAVTRHRRWARRRREIE